MSSPPSSNDELAKDYDPTQPSTSLYAEFRRRSKLRTTEGQANNAEMSKKKKEKPLKRDNTGLDSFHPVGLPGRSREITQFVYYWVQSKGQERQIREPKKKPDATPIDDEFLGVLPPSTAQVAWDHLKTNKKRPSLEDFNDIPVSTILVRTKHDHSVSVRDVDTETPVPRKTITVKISRPPSQATINLEAHHEDRQPSNVPLSACTHPEFPSIELEVEQFCQQEWPGDSPCVAALGDMKKYRNCLGDLNLNSSRYTNCTHTTFKVIPGKIRRFLPWAPCVPIPRHLLICQCCGAAFREKQAGKNRAGLELCGNVTKNGGLVVSNLDPQLAGFEPVCAESKKPRVKCPCQTCQRRRRRVGVGGGEEVLTDDSLSLRKQKDLSKLKDLPTPLDGSLPIPTERETLFKRGSGGSQHPNQRKLLKSNQQTNLRNVQHPNRF